jgi:hypothetical protein
LDPDLSINKQKVRKNLKLLLCIFSMKTDENVPSKGTVISKKLKKKLVGILSANDEKVGS